MTWEEFVYSSYNDGSVQIAELSGIEYAIANGAQVKYGSTNQTASDFIIPSAAYTATTSSGGAD